MVAVSMAQVGISSADDFPLPEIVAFSMPLTLRSSVKDLSLSQIVPVTLPE